jgi:hypothetical protein
MEGRGLLGASIVIGLSVAAMYYFLFVVHAPEERQASSTSATSTANAMPWLVASPWNRNAKREADTCRHRLVSPEAFEEIHAQARKAADAAFDSLKDRLAASGDPRQAALGLYLQQSTEELVRLASGSDDPQIYALALLSCHYQPYGEPCGSLSMEHWADIEPDNGVPWVFIANRDSWDFQSDSRSRTRFDQAMYRLSTARRFDPHFPNFLGLMQLPELRDQAPETREVLEEDLVAMKLTLPSLPYRPFFRYCNFPSTADPSHYSGCNDLAKLLIERDNTVIGLAVGTKLAQSALWSPARISELRERKAQYDKALRAAAVQPRDGVRSDCEEQTALERWAADYSSLGERGLAEQYIRESKLVGLVGRR